MRIRTFNITVITSYLRCQISTADLDDLYSKGDDPLILEFMTSIRVCHMADDFCSKSSHFKQKRYMS